ncbi:hypothetical protein [Roseomonas rosulenta]|uniref:hypothetical protein n=1 Tax=Roseomonas rosulenta TaxID=2748667 RepID=UPI0018DFADE5|nr:hypothetical protein [Roseomonas rosulenta]
MRFVSDFQGANATLLHALMRATRPPAPRYMALVPGHGGANVPETRVACFVRGRIGSQRDPEDLMLPATAPARLEPAPRPEVADGAGSALDE